MNFSGKSLSFHRRTVPARITEFALDDAPVMDALAVVPAVRGPGWMKYGEHACYFLDFRTRRGVCVGINHSDVIGPGLARFQKAATGNGGISGKLRCLFRKYHYGFSFLEEIMLMTVPHTVTDMGNGRFLVNLWSYFGYLSIDCRARSVTYHLLKSDDDIVLGARQWYDRVAGELFCMAYPLGESLARITSPECDVMSGIWRMNPDSDCAECVWTGPMADFMHDFALSPDRRYWAACELGMYKTDSAGMLPSRIVVGETGQDWNRQWRIDDITVAAHVEFDPEEGGDVYFSSHNFQFEHTSLFKLMRQATYTVNFKGPATICKYRVYPDGPREIGRFSRSDFLRLTNMHVFRNGGRKIIAAMGFPDEIFIIDADTMSFVRKIKVREPGGAARSDRPALIGTIAPSPDGNRIFVQTTKSFQVVNTENGEADYALCNGRYHSCANHMLAVRGEGWS